MKTHHIIKAQAIVILGLLAALGGIALGGGTHGASAATQETLRPLVKPMQVRQVSMPSGISGVQTVCATNAKTGKILTCTTNGVIPAPGR